MGPRLPFALLLALLPVGCADDAPPPLGAGEFTSEAREDGSLLARNGPLHEAPPLHVLEPDLVLGELSGPPEAEFGRVAGLSLDPEAHLHVLDAMVRQVKVFDARGGWVRTLSRGGEGPGEIQGGNALLHDDKGRLWVHDPTRGALIALDAEGREVASAPNPVRGASPSSRVALGPDGRFHELTRVQTMAGATSRGGGFSEVEGRMVLVSSAPDDPAVDSVFLTPITSQLYMAGDEGQQVIVSVPEQPGFHGVLDPEGYLWTTPGHDELGHFGLLRLAPGGDTVLRVEAAVERPRVDPERYREWAERVGSTSILRHLPERGPTMAGLLSDGEGRIWAQRAPRVGVVEDDEGEPRTTWDVFAPDGRWLGAVASGVPLVTTNRALRIMDGALYGVTRGEMNEELVVRMPIPELGG